MSSLSVFCLERRISVCAFLGVARIPKQRTLEIDAIECIVMQKCTPLAFSFTDYLLDLLDLGEKLSLFGRGFDAALCVCVRARTQRHPVDCRDPTILFEWCLWSKIQCRSVDQLWVYAYALFQHVCISRAMHFRARSVCTRMY